MASGIGDMLKLAHFSDVHLTAKPLGWTVRDLVSKKVPGWINVRLLGRGARFKHAADIVVVLREDLRSRGYDHLIFSGDATKLAFPREFANSAERLGVGDPSLPPAIAVPGNHDYYTGYAVSAGHFESHFAPWLAGERIDAATYPFARKVGPAWLIAVNSSTANFWTFDASGAIGPEQMDRLHALCRRLDAGPRILITHYPLRAPNGRPERRTHRLRNHADALKIAKECQISLWLHGHIHTPYVLPPTAEIPFPTISAGSCTQTNKWHYNEYLLAGNTLTVTHRRFDMAVRAYRDAGTTTLTLPHA
jgi:3',5'-cyclic AMP phosphodiesterase CpdA